MITPDAKDWTWTLSRPCPECGFDASSCTAGEVPALIRANADDWNKLLARGLIESGRDDESKWSGLEYASHVRDVYVRYDERIALMLDQKNPQFPNWDQDATAEEERYDEQDSAPAVMALRVAAEALAERLEGLSDKQWQRPGRRSDGASFTVDTISRYMVHDTIHHIWDITGVQWQPVEVEAEA